MNRRKLLPLALCLVAAAALAGLVQGDSTEPATPAQPDTSQPTEPQPAEPQPTTAPSPEVFFGAGLNAVIDEETGRLRAPTEEEIHRFEVDREIHRGLEPRKVFAPLAVEHRQDGTVVTHLDERFGTAAVVTLGEGGALEVTHHAPLRPEDAAVFFEAMGIATPTADLENDAQKEGGS